MDTAIKAKELVENFWHEISGVPNHVVMDFDSEDSYVILAKQCALIDNQNTIDALELAKEFIDDNQMYAFNMFIGSFEQVRKHIEGLQ